MINSESNEIDRTKKLKTKNKQNKTDDDDDRAHELERGTTDHEERPTIREWTDT